MIHQTNAGGKTGTDLIAEVSAGIKRGWAFTPVKGKGASEDSKPRKGWQREKPLTVDQLAGYMERDYNVALRSGEVSGVIVIDDDRAKHNLPPLDLPQTVTVLTGGGGTHRYYKTVEGVEIKCPTKHGLGEYIDVKGNNGMAVFPGSIHPDTGNQYVWADGLSPDDIEVAELPKWIVEVLTRKKNGVRKEDSVSGNEVSEAWLDKRVEENVAEIRASQNGSRNNTITECSFRVGQVVHLYPYGRAFDMLFDAALYVGEEDRKARDTIKRALDAGADSQLDVTLRRNGKAKLTGTKSEPVKQPTRAVMRTIADVERQYVKWLWKGRLARGKASIIDGDPGISKSTLTCHIAARISTGGAFYGEEYGREPAGVLMVSAEDDAGDTIRPRLEADSADLTRVHVLDSMFDDKGERPVTLPDDLAAIEAAIVERNIALVVFDPFLSFLNGRIDSHKDGDMRRAMMHLSKMAERTGVCVLLVRHMNKGNAKNPLHKGSGSIGTIGATRVGLMLAADPDSPNRRILAPTKCNNGIMPKALAYRVESNAALDVGYIVWEGETAHTAGDLIADQGEPTRVDEAERVARDILADGEMPSPEVYKLAAAAGVATPTLRRALDKMGVKPRQVRADGKVKGWAMSLPDQGNQKLDDQPPSQTFDHLGQVAGFSKVYEGQDDLDDQGLCDGHLSGNETDDEPF